MDETSYSDPVIVSTIAKNFIPIRVDTDQRPDVNRRYNLGGWPTTAFLDGQGKIITGGTYIPPDQLREVLRSVLDFYSNNKGKVRSKLERRPLPTQKEGTVTERVTRDIATTIAVNFDIDYGGFGFEPKFPHAEALEFALLRFRYYGEKEMLTVVTKTLDRMGSGGMYDQIEQGFFRYSTTRDWSIPHFEKMAEDNAKLLSVYLHAFQITGNAAYKDKAQGIVNYVQANLSDLEQGGFYGSQDADEEYYNLDLAKRKGRESPSIDRTLYTNYNALFVSAFLLAAVVLVNESLGKFALKTIDRLLALGGPSSPFHYWKRETGPTARGFLVDSATLLNSLIDAYEYSSNVGYLQTAVKVADRCIQDLHDNEQGGFYDIPSANTNLGELSTRDKPIDENSLIATALLRLSWITGQDSFAITANKTIELFKQDYERYGLASSIYALAVDLALNGPISITIVANSKSKEFASFKSNALRVYSARRMLSYLDPVKDTARIANLGYDSSKPTAYVCVGKKCGPPLHSPTELEISLTSLLEPKPVAT